MSNYNPGDYIHHPDPANMTTCCEDNGGSVGGGGNSVGAGAPSASASAGDIYIQTDSTPPGVIWTYYSGAWH